MIDELTHGKFLDKRNVNHVVNAMSTTKENFNLSDTVDPKLLNSFDRKHSSFYYSINGNPYVGLSDGNKIIIFSPDNFYLKRMIKVYLDRVNKGKIKSELLEEGQMRRLESFIKGEVQELKSSYTTYDWEKIILEIKKSFTPSWDKIASCVVDLDKKQVYFFD